MMMIMMMIITLYEEKIIDFSHTICSCQRGLYFISIGHVQSQNIRSESGLLSTKPRLLIVPKCNSGTVPWVICLVAGFSLWKWHLLIYLLTPWSRVLLEKLTGLQLVKKLPAFYGTLRFITAFTSVCHLSLS
jgi:hypothetical protein